MRREIALRQLGVWQCTRQRGQSPLWAPADQGRV